MKTEAWNLSAPGIRGLHVLLIACAKAARGTDVVVAPFDEDLLARVGVWVEGPADQVASVIEKAQEAMDGETTAVRYDGVAR